MKRHNWNSEEPKLKVTEDHTFFLFNGGEKTERLIAN